LSVAGVTVYGVAGTLSYGDSPYQGASTNEWPATNGPANVNIGPTTYFILPNGTFSRTITGNLGLNDIIDLGGNTLTVGGNISGGSSGYSYGGTIVMTGNMKTIDVPFHANLEINNADGLITLTNYLVIYNTLTLTSGKLAIGNNQCDVFNGTIISSPTSYIITDGSTGKLVLAVPTTGKLFPIGSSATSYDPVFIDPVSNETFFVNVKAAPMEADFPGMLNDFDNVVQRLWNISPQDLVATADITFTNGAGGFTPTSPVIGHYSGGTWTEVPAMYSSNTWNGTISSFSPFGVGEEGAFGMLCDPPVPATDPTDQLICETGVAMFTGSFTGGTPAPSLNWQVQTGGMGGFIDLSEGAPYSGTTTGTLSITTTDISLSTNRYRLKATNGCGDVFTDDALLTVEAQPIAPVIERDPDDNVVCPDIILTINVTTPGSGGFTTCSDEYRFSTDGGSTWSDWDTDPPSFFSVLGTNIVEGRRFCDGEGCESVNQVEWTVEDDEDPMIVTCPTDRFIDGCTSESIFDPVFSSDTATTTLDVFEDEFDNIGEATDNCSLSEIVKYIDVETPADCGIDVVRTWVISDVAGNRATCMQNITVRGLPIDTFVPANTIYPSCQTQQDIDDAFANWLGGFQALFGCDVMVTTDPPAPVAPDLCGGMTSVTWTVTSE
jgi:hypothetical protein